MKLQRLGFALAMGVVLAAGIAVHLYRAPTAHDALLWQTHFLDAQDQPHRLKPWHGQVLIINYWGTWCPPCRDEIPIFMRLQRELHPRGLQVLGIALDNPTAVKAYATTFGISYPILFAGTAGMSTMQALGNPAGVLPYTMIVDRHGEIKHRMVGAVSESQLRQWILPLLDPA